MKFRTEIPIQQFPFEITYETRMLFLGSCFSEHISAYLHLHRFPVTANPFGILFNPLSIAAALDEMTGTQTIDDRHFDFYNEKWLSFAHHGRFSHTEKAQFEEGIQQSITQGKRALREADLLFVTLGTAYYYWHKERELVVANCHKLPANTFDKRRATVEKIENAFHDFFTWRQQSHPDLKVVFTVSPVRHLADGFHENQLSKSVLHLAIDALIARYPETYYFPSYEIFQDDLRDYRFYDNDLCHPSAQGLAYVQEKVAEAFFSDATRQKLKEVSKEVKRENHRPNN